MLHVTCYSMFALYIFIGGPLIIICEYKNMTDFSMVYKSIQNFMPLQKLAKYVHNALYHVVFADQF